MEGTAGNAGVDINNRIAGYQTVSEGFHDPLHDSRDVFFWKIASGSSILGSYSLPLFVRREAESDMTICRLASKSSITDKFPIALSGCRDCFAISDLWLTHIRLHPELTFQAIDDDFEVKLAHSSNNGLPGLLVSLDYEGGIFVRETIESDDHLVRVSLSSRLNSHRDNRLGKTWWL